MFPSDLEKDVRKLRKLAENLNEFERQFNENMLLDTTIDTKLNRLLEIVAEKQNSSRHCGLDPQSPESKGILKQVQNDVTNKKVIIFTVYSDTARFLYKNIKKLYPNRVACVTGSEAMSNNGYSGKKFEPILERFAPYTKLYKEKEWDFEGDYEEWKNWIKSNSPKTYEKLQNPVDILIATDCLSEGQNMQDCDLIINYDIHWNPVRLIQRMGRIDRLGSKNETVKGINFWPAKDYEDYLNLKSRVENRMAAMTLVGTELNEELTPELQQMIKDNPLISEQTQKMLAQLQLTWDDVEDGEETLGLNDLSLEEFRQELVDFFRQKEEFFKQMPNGIYTGFKKRPHEKFVQIPDSVIAVLGYPKRPEDTKDWTYDEIQILHQPLEQGNSGSKPAMTIALKNRNEILNFLRFHKKEERSVPKPVDDGEPTVIKLFCDAVAGWITAQATPVAIAEIQDLFAGNGRDAARHVSAAETPLIEEKFQVKKFDLICWFVVSK
ncbi:MAG: hypothetical protein LBR48_03975 [Dysgonamonadaceae bacterium]|jgi:hypothetical protein|nr:hypothetical protein [Dysgonamonadaceae bacterium]